MLLANVVYAMTVIGVTAAALAVMSVGILGLPTMSTARRTKEIGIRCALGDTADGDASVPPRTAALRIEERGSPVRVRAA